MTKEQLTEYIFTKLNDDKVILDLDFADSGNEIFARDSISGAEFTITVTQN